ncbi:MAG TPA: M23 family metallopeptidase [Stackebrandtia sp.]|jgi:hypothetical protein|uniref:M23 family metallopeptidase n=1 Tax=Stackebrandtia sp. TaxID=2023065 RepID=UPI002D668756|nr:M23 family metallopeptidase [Stackebrandtia sp.]HZE37917.1 M23 family metallopeptidase [Stackebrandtia sp.]
MPKVKLPGILKKKRWLLGLSAAVALIAAATIPVFAQADVNTTSKPAFQMPFHCGQTWQAATFTGHSPQLAVDWQSYGGHQIDGTPVAAAAAGKVIHAGTMSGTGYGNLVIVDHGGGWTTFYAHLKNMSVHVGSKVGQGGAIGHVGSTGHVSGPHLHFEERYNNHVEKVVVGGKQVPYYGHTPFKSKNTCGGSSGNPYTASDACGSGYKTVDSQALGKAGRVYLMYNSGNGYNCVATIKNTSIGKSSAASAFLEPKNGKRSTNSGSFKYYAGPVKKSAKKTCVKWGGSVGSSNYTSGFEHCG